MLNAVQQLCESRGCTVTALITELLRQKLANGGRNIHAAIAHATRAFTGRRTRLIPPSVSYPPARKQLNTTKNT